ncbi:MAG TPA: hypothetical protein VNL70_00875, partial [Tepidisphaeraceae bacterium]|nr:hypothetical protein [Tepidisphaeraceae bacterium]
VASAQQGAAPAAPAADEAEKRRAEAQSLVEQAEAARAANRLDEARALYTRAAELDPNNTAAIRGRDEVAALLNITTGQPDLLTQREAQIRQQQQYITYSFNTAISDARRAIEARNFADARAAIERARVARNSNPGIFTQEQIRQFDTTIAETQLAYDRAVEADRLAQEEAARRTAQQMLREQQETAEQQKQRTIRDLIRQARTLTQEGKYQQALGVIDQILTLDPQNDYAQGARPLVEDRAIIQEQRIYRERYDRNVVRQYNAAEEQKIPYSDILKYPENWPDLSATRDRTVAQERGERAEDAVVMAQLERKLPEVRFDNVAFADVIDFLRDVSATNIFVNWRALEAAGIDRNAPVTARLRDVKFSKALSTILSDVGGGLVRLGYTIDEGVITISTEEDLSSNVVTRVYDIRDLIINVTDFDQPPDFQLQGAQVGGGGGGQQLFSGTTAEETEAATRADLVDAITSLIRDTVASDTWRDNGGTIGSMRELGGQLIVTQTPENQRQLVRLLEQLRETRAIQITVETRFLSVQRNFLEDIGVDFDMLIPAGQLWSQVGTISISQDHHTYTSLPNLTTGVPGNIATELSSAVTEGTIPATFAVGNGAGGGVTFLDDFQVSVLLRATQATQNATSLTAPRLTLFNGQRAYMAVSTDTAYVSDLTPIVGTQAVAFDPQPAVQPAGVILDVQATVSSDRKYVTLTLRPTLTRLLDLVNFPVTALTAGTEGSPPITQTAFLQQPIIQSTVVRTTVSVPDGGTLLLGGQTLAGEVEREAGVPVLSKIPFLKRLFTNQSMAKDEQILLILVKPTIIIQREKEQEQFPLLTTKVGG